MILWARSSNKKKKSNNNNVTKIQVVELQYMLGWYSCGICIARENTLCFRGLVTFTTNALVWISLYSHKLFLLHVYRIVRCSRKGFKYLHYHIRLYYIILLCFHWPFGVLYYTKISIENLTWRVRCV